MYGGSYLGIAQWKAALAQNPHLKAIFPYVSGRRRLPRPLLFPRRRHEARAPPAVACGEHARAAVSFRPISRAMSRRCRCGAADAAATGHRLDAWNDRDRPSRRTTSSGKTSASGSISKTSAFRSIRWAAGTTITSRAISTPSRFSASTTLDDRIMIGPWPHVFSATFRERELRERFAGVAAARSRSTGSTAG